MAEFVYDFTAENGIPFRAVFEPVSGNDVPEYAKAGTVAFYDRRYDHTPDGQFTGGRYYVDDLLDRNPEVDLWLYGGVADWTVDAGHMAKVLTWLERIPR